MAAIPDSAPAPIPCDLDIRATLIDQRVGQGLKDDAPHLRWPARISNHPKACGFPGNLDFSVTRPDGSVPSVVLEHEDGRLSVRVYADNTDGDPLMNVGVRADNTLEGLSD